MKAISERAGLVLAVGCLALCLGSVVIFAWLLGAGFFMKYGGLLIGFSIGHLIYQFFTNKDYSKAMESFFFQFVAVGIASWLC